MQGAVWPRRKLVPYQQNNTGAANKLSAAPLLVQLKSEADVAILPAHGRASQDTAT
jgi:hypothetical protein